MSNYNENKRITKSNNVERRQITSLAIRASSPASSQEEVYLVSHVLIFLGFVPTPEGPRGPRPCLKIGPM